jgi:hypothetical protein
LSWFVRFRFEEEPPGMVVVRRIRGGGGGIVGLSRESAGGPIGPAGSGRPGPGLVCEIVDAQNGRVIYIHFDIIYRKENSV